MAPNRQVKRARNLVDLKAWNMDSCIAAAVILLGVVIWVLIPYQVDEPPAFLRQIHAGMSPSLFPRLAALGFVIIGVLYLLTSFDMNSENGFAELTRQDYAEIALVLVLMTAYVTLLQPLGFVVSSALSAVAIALLYGSRNVIGIGIVALIAPLLIYFMFTRLLNVSLPAFPWFTQ